jgi:glycogen synthase
VPPEDHDALRSALLRLIEKPAERSRLAQAALARAQHFTPARKCDGYLRAYARLGPRFAPAPTEELACA